MPRVRAAIRMRHQHVVVGIADVVPLGLLADLQRAHVQARHHVGRAEHQRLHPRARRDRVDVGQALRRSRSAPRCRCRPTGSPWVALELGQQQVQRLNVGDVGHLRQHHDVEVRPRGRHHLDDVGVGPRRGPVVDPHAAQLPGPARLGQRRRHLGARLGLGVGRDRILEVEEHLIGGQTLGLLDHLRAAAGNRKHVRRGR